MPCIIPVGFCAYSLIINLNQYIDPPTHDIQIHDWLFYESNFFLTTMYNDRIHLFSDILSSLQEPVAMKVLKRGLVKNKIQPFPPVC